MNKILWTIVNLLAATAVVFALVLPKLESLNDLNSKIKDKKTEIQMQERYFANLNDVSQKLQESAEGVSKVNSALPDTPSVHSLIYFLQQKASSSGLLLKKIDFLNPVLAKENQNIVSLPLYLEVSGQYSSFKKFISEVEKSARLVEVDNVSFSSSSGQKSSGFNFKLGLRVNSYQKQQ